MTGAHGLHVSWWVWVAFNVFVLALLALDLGVLQRRSEAMGMRRSLLLTGFYVALGLAFGALIYALAGPRPFTEYLAGYVLEKSLSLDNIFVFVVIFNAMRVTRAYQHRVLFWGILGALVMRGLFIAAGATLIAAFHWVIYLLGGLLIFSGGRLLLRGEPGPKDPRQNPVLRLARRYASFTSDYHGSRFFVRRNGALCATPLLAALILVESTDVVFALDSIPAIFSVTDSAFIIYTSNVFAILGLRALYFVLRGTIERFRYLSKALALLLLLIGAKMLASGFVEVPVWATLVAVAVLLGGGILLSLARDGRRGRTHADARRRG